MLAALHFLDPVLGIDAHIRLMPAPTVIPTLFVGLLGDWKDFITTNLVLVNGRPRVQASTTGFGWHDPPATPSLKPDGTAEVLLGSSTVLVEGKPMAYGPLPVLSCHGLGRVKLPNGKRTPTTSSLLPTSIALPIAYAGQVWIGGEPTGVATPFLERARRRPVALLCKGLRKLRVRKLNGRRLARQVRWMSKHYEYFKKSSDLAQDA